MSAKPHNKSSSDYELRVHRDWINTLQPVGLVVSAPALVAAQVFPDRNITAKQQTLRSLFPPLSPTPPDLLTVLREVLGWPIDDGTLVGGRSGGPPVPPELSVPLPEFGETLRPSYAVRNLYYQPGDADSPAWALLIQTLLPRTSFDDPGAEESRRWHASPQVRLERLLRETGVPAGILWNGVALRLVYAPRGESSGHLTWPLSALLEVGGRSLLSALDMLLGSGPLFSAPHRQSLLHILRESRKYQNVVSTKLAAQVLEALNELLRGFESASAARHGALLDSLIREEPEHVYGGLLASLLRIVFILYAEERGLLPTDEVYVRGYSLTGLFDKLRQDDGRFPDTMEQRYGAWTRLCVLFRLIFDGAKHNTLQLPARKGHLFDPDGWPFLEGRPRSGARQVGVRLDVPKVSDAAVYRVLQKLLILDGDRLSYRALDVEQIGSVYESMMGFTLERASDLSLGVGGKHVVISLDALLVAKASERNKWLKEQADVELSGKAATALRDATTHDDLVAALERRRSPLTKQPIPKGGLYLQPTDERRRSGSHYTPRELTGPIVRKTLAPLLSALGPVPTPQQILDLKICDPAMGSGAFLVEACRQLAEQLLSAWEHHGRPDNKPDDEDWTLFAQRLVAQQCLYGVDKNPFAVDLGKLSLWLATLARLHSFAFVDHALRHGDSLVGLSREQVASFHWQPSQQIPLLRTCLDRALSDAESLRKQIQALANSDDDAHKIQLHQQASAALDEVRLYADCVVGCFFGGQNDKQRKLLRKDWESKVADCLAGRGSLQALRDFVTELREPSTGQRPVPAFHWQLEFPEVFSRLNPGFDAFVGNPPFLGGKSISTHNGDAFLAWLGEMNPESNGSSDLVAYFFRQSFKLLRGNGTLGLIATNTIAQGDTRSTGLRYLCQNGGTIYDATRRYKWPGHAAVIVSVVHVQKGRSPEAKFLDGKQVPLITAFLFHGGSSDDPVRLQECDGKSFIGSYVLGMGFTFDDGNPDATPIEEMHRLIAKDRRNRERIFPYLGGEELNTSPTHAHRRYVINFGDMSEADAGAWPDLLQIVERKVKPERAHLKRDVYRLRWWQFAEKQLCIQDAITGLERVLCCSLHSKGLSFAHLPANSVFSHGLAVFPLETHAAFAALQSRVHELWARFFGSSMKDDLRYTPSDCFETFPFPVGWESDPQLEAVGREYYDYRAHLMVRNDEGLTATYNRFHDPDEADPEIGKLRTLHDAMDRAVLAAYGWTDLQPQCKFLLDYEDEDSEDEAESGRPRKRKKPWRYRWPDEVRDEVLARLLALNSERAQQEREQQMAAAFLGDTKPMPEKKASRSKKPAKNPEEPSGGQGSLF
jgi:hypothetical protein